MLNRRNPSLYPKSADPVAAYDDLLVYFTTNTSSRKVSDISNDPCGRAYYCHPRRRRGMALVGDLAETRNREVRHPLRRDDWKAYYPCDVEDPDYAVIRLRPRTARGWDGRMTAGLSLGMP